MVDIKLLQRDYDTVAAALTRKGVDASVLDKQGFNNLIR